MSLRVGASCSGWELRSWMGVMGFCKRSALGLRLGLVAERYEESGSVVGVFH